MNKDIVLRFLLAFTSIILLLAAIWTVLPTPEESGLYDGFVRLHVIADSDSEEGQAVKLLVRDRILQLTPSVTAGAEDSAAVSSAFAENSEYIREEAETVLRENGFTYGARVEVGRELYPTREYEGVTLPAGIYSSVRIVLGKGEGKNWWCILFPPLCTNCARVEEQMVEAGFTEGQMAILTGGRGRYKLKFRFLELISQFLM